MTLGGWFRDYLFYPVLRSSFCKKLAKRLKGSVSKNVARTVTTCLALAIVWFTTGLWHGASWHYVAWGIYYGALIILSTVTKPWMERTSEALNIDRDARWWRLFCIGRTFFLVLLGYVLFRADSMAHAAGIIVRIAAKFSPAFNAPGLGPGLDHKDRIVAAAGMLVLFAADLLKYRKVDIAGLFHRLPLVIRWTILYAAIASILLFGIYGPGYDSSSFIYFKF